MKVNKNPIKYRDRRFFRCIRLHENVMKTGRDKLKKKDLKCIQMVKIVNKIIKTDYPVKCLYLIFPLSS